MNINYATRQLIRSSTRGYMSTNFDPKNLKIKKLTLKIIFLTLPSLLLLLTTTLVL